MATLFYQGHGSFRLETAQGKVIYVDTGLAEDVRQAAQKMIGEDSSLLLCKAGEEYLELEKWKRGAGAD